MSQLDDDPATIALERQQEVIEADAKHLQLDLDGDGVNIAMHDRLMQEGIVESGWLALDSKTPSHRHVYIKLTQEVRSKAARIALQMALGSDPVREILSLLRLIKMSSRPPILLFEDAEKARQVREFLGKSEPVDSNGG